MFVRLIFILILLSSCTKEFLIHTPDNMPKVVIEGLVTNEETPYIRLTWSISNSQSYTNSNLLNPQAEPISNAIVWLKDNHGNSEKLQMYKRYEPYADSSFSGYYFAKNLKGIPGYEYNLSVTVNEKTYEAYSKMPNVVQIDSIGVKYLTGKVSNKFDGYRSIIYFRDNPQEKNFYITKNSIYVSDTDTAFFALPPYIRGFNSTLSSRIWNFSVISDQFLTTYINGLNLDIGNTPSTYFQESLYSNSKYIGRLYSITEETYNYYKVLIDSFKNDGGAYSPSPANAPTNIKGGALGFFVVTAGSSKVFEVP